MSGQHPALGSSVSWESVRLAFDASPAIVVAFAGEDLRLAYQNPRSALLQGERPLGAALPDAFPEIADWELGILEKTFAKGAVARVQTVPVTLAGGNHGVFDVVFSPLVSGVGSVHGVLVHAVEVAGGEAPEHLRNAVLLGRASAELSSSLDVGQVTEAIARLAAEVFEGWCVLDLWEPDGSLRRAAGYHSDPARRRALQRLMRLPRIATRRSGHESVASSVARTGIAAGGTFDADELIARASSPEHQRILRRLQPGPYMVVPLQAGPRRLGALTVLRHSSAPPFTALDRASVEQFAERATIALDHARDYDEQRQAVLALQRSTLRPAPPSIPGVEIALRYRAAGAGASVGGDWYDVFELEGGSLGIAVGDVQGHDLAAAAVMSQLRSVVHSHARAGMPPALVVDHANVFICEEHEEHLVTMSYVQLHPVEHLMIWTRAGHMPIVSVSADDRRRLEARGGLPLGVDVRGRWLEHTTRLPTAGVTALFTDGLIESGSPDLDEGLDRLTSLLHDHQHEPLEVLADRVIGELVPERPRRGDDVALVLFRLTAEAPGGRNRFVRRLPPAATSTAVARHFVEDLLPQWGVSSDTGDVAALLVSELVTNAARHGDGPIELRLEAGGKILRVEVFDDSHRLPPPVPAVAPSYEDTAGRGLQLVAALSSSWGVTPDGVGKAVWFELPLSR